MPPRLADQHSQEKTLSIRLIALDGRATLVYTQLRCERTALILFLGSSTVEQAAVNRKVRGSNPLRGANFHAPPRPRNRFAPGFFIASVPRSSPRQSRPGEHHELGWRRRARGLSV